MIKQLSQSEGHNVGFSLRGKITLGQEQEWTSSLNLVLEEHEKINVLVVLEEDVHWGVDAAWQDIKWLFAHIKRFNKIAIISSSPTWHWLITIDSFFAAIMDTEERHFLPSDIDRAWLWLEES